MNTQQWARTARADHAAARHALGAGDFPHSVFWFQQSAEKALKGLVLAIKPDATEEDLRRYGHRPLEFAREAMTNLAAEEERVTRNLGRPHVAREPIFDPPPDFISAEETLDDMDAALALNDTPDKTSAVMIAEKVSKADAIEESLHNPDDDEVRRWVHEEKGPARQRFLSGRPQPGDVRVLDLAAARQAYLEAQESFSTIIRLDTVCYILHPHVEAPRYGCDTRGPAEIYTATHALVAALPMLLDYHHRTLTLLEQQLAPSP